jgi:hypothetical protein
MELAERYWSIAREAEGLALQASSNEIRARYLAWAESWRLLGDLAAEAARGEARPATA